METAFIVLLVVLVPLTSYIGVMEQIRQRRILVRYAPAVPLYWALALITAAAVLCALTGVSGYLVFVAFGVYILAEDVVHMRNWRR